MYSDIEIASSAKIKRIEDIAEKIGINSDYLEQYGKYIGKISLDIRNKSDADARVVLVTAMTPTPFGEGKTTVSIGLNDALNKIGKRSIVTLREPSLGPVFGIKGGAAGGGYSQVIPMEDINLHFTGDIHAVTSAHNLLAALIDNNYSTSEKSCMLPGGIFWNRVMDMNDRSLRNVIIGLGDKGGQIRESGFQISAASEVMAILGLSYDLEDLKRRLSRVIVAKDKSGSNILAKDLGAEDAMTIILKNAVKPNLVQSLEGNAAIIHAGPFANIAHGTNSIIALDIARRLSDYVVIEAGFGSDLGAEKFFDIVSRQKGGAYPDAVVIVATIRALKYHGGSKKKDLKNVDLNAIKKGIPNLEKHIENMKSFNRPVFVALNTFESDSKEEISLVEKSVIDLGAELFKVTVWQDGGAGAIELAERVSKISLGEESTKNFVYDLDDNISDKIIKIAKKIYGADDVVFQRKVRKKIALLEKGEYKDFPICMAKTQSSISDDSKLRGRPTDFDIEVKDIRVSAGAGFIVVYTGDVLTMPGLPKHPASENMSIDNNGKVSGLF